MNYTFIKCLNLVKDVDYNKFIDLISVFDYDQIDNNTYEKLKNDFKTKQTNFFDEMFNNYLKYVAQLPTVVDSLQYVITLLILYDLEDINEAYNSDLALDFIDNLLSIRHNIINNDFNNFYVIKNDYDIKRIKDNILNIVNKYDVFSIKFKSYAHRDYIDDPANSYNFTPEIDINFIMNENAYTIKLYIGFTIDTLYSEREYEKDIIDIESIKDFIKILPTTNDGLSNRDKYLINLRLISYIDVDDYDQLDFYFDEDKELKLEEKTNLLTFRNDLFKKYNFRDIDDTSNISKDILNDYINKKYFKICDLNDKDSFDLAMKLYKMIK